MRFSEAGKIQHIARLYRGLGTQFVHQADGALNDVAQLTRPTVGALQNAGRTFKVISGK